MEYHCHNLILLTSSAYMQHTVASVISSSIIAVNVELQKRIKYCKLTLIANCITSNKFIVIYYAVSKSPPPLKKITDDLDY